MPHAKQAERPREHLHAEPNQVLTTAGQVSAEPAAAASPRHGGPRSPRAERRAFRPPISAFTGRPGLDGISGSELVCLPPRRADAPCGRIAAGRILADDPEVGRHLSTQHALALKTMQARTDPGRHRLKRPEASIIAIARRMRPEFPA